MNTNNRQQRSESDKEKARLMNGVDINSEKQEHEDNKRQIGSCVSDFTIVKELGRGSYGVVYRAISNINKKEYVVKKINIKHMSNKHQKEALKEAQILRKVRHENIIRYYTSFVEHDCLYIVMEYADGGDLQQVNTQILFLLFYGSNTFLNINSVILKSCKPLYLLSIVIRMIL